jgi:hypothetical protein
VVRPLLLLLLAAQTLVPCMIKPMREQSEHTVAGLPTCHTLLAAYRGVSAACLQLEHVQLLKASVLLLLNHKSTAQSAAGCCCLLWLAALYTG